MSRSNRQSFVDRLVCERLPTLVLLLTAVAVVSMLACSNVLASAAPAWHIYAVSKTTTSPGDKQQYDVQIYNGGTAPTSEPYTVKISLPPGMSAIDAGSDLLGFPTFGWSCSGPEGAAVAEATLVTCTSSVELEGASEDFNVPGPHPLGTESVFVLHAAVDPEASGVLTSTFEVTGGGASTPAQTSNSTPVIAAPLGFGVGAFETRMTQNALGDPFTQAGGHPYAITTAIDFNSIADPNPLKGQPWPVEPTKDVVVDLPPGFAGNPTALPRCSIAELENSHVSSAVPLCAPATQVGTIAVRLNGGRFGAVVSAPVFNLVPPPEVPARFGFNVLGTIVVLDAKVRSDGDYGVSVASHDLPEGFPVVGSSVTFWGIPADPSHDAERSCANPENIHFGCSAGVPATAFLREPTACSALGLTLGLHVDSWLAPGRLNINGEPDLGDTRWKNASDSNHQLPGYPWPSSQWGPEVGVTGCERVPFTPTLTTKPTAPAQANSPSGLTVDLSLPQSDDPNAVGEADLKKTIVTLPPGLRLSPSSAGDLVACSPAQIGLFGTGFPEPNRIHFNTAEPSCPENSKLGTLSIETPLLEKPLTGSLYLATPHENPFGSLMAIYLVAKGPGVIVKLPGHVDLDPSTGQITTTFDDTPQLPFSNLHLELKSGPRAALVLPARCGTYTTHAVLTSWSGKTVASASNFTVSEGPGGTPCPPGPFAPSFTAGTTNGLAGGFSPFTLQLQRSDGEEELGALSTLSMPPGLLADVASVTARCTDAQASAAACPAASHIGTVTVGAGPGSNPFYVSGDIYLMGRSSTGAFAGDPFGVAVVVHAAAGPFDLGYTVVTGGIQVRDDGSIAVQTEPFPRILQGIPLQLRDVRVLLDRPGFIFNPTSCNPLSVNATVLSTEGHTTPVASRFQAGECRALAFKPSFSGSTSGHTSKADGASLDVRIASAQGPHPPGAPGEANIGKVEVALPSALPSRLTTLQKACTEAQFAANPAGCPPASDVGTAVAHTPILASALEGPAYLVSHGGQAFPDLVLVLQGEGIVLHVTGHTQIKKGVTSSRFETVPDAPISSFELKLPEGPFSALAANVNLCGRAVTTTRRVTSRIHGHTRSITINTHHRIPANLAMPTTITAQNGAVLRQTTRIAVTGCAKAKASRHARRAHARRTSRRGR